MKKHLPIRRWKGHAWRGWWMERRFLNRIFVLEYRTRIAEDEDDHVLSLHWTKETRFGNYATMDWIKRNWPWLSAGG
jgi:hypothetical protein